MALLQSGDRISGKSDSVTAALVRFFALVTGLLLVRSAVAQTVTFTEIYPIQQYR